MLYVFFGNDTISVREKAHAVLSDFQKHGEVAASITAESYQDGLLVDLISSTSLFSEKQIIVFDTPSERTEFFDAVMDNLDAFGTSENIFVIIETSLLAADKKKVLRHADTAEEYTG